MNLVNLYKINKEILDIIVFYKINVLATLLEEQKTISLACIHKYVPAAIMKS